MTITDRDGQTDAGRFNVPSMERAVRLTAVITRRDDMFSAKAVEVDVAALGHSVEESLTALEDALAGYFEARPLPVCDPAGPIIAPVNVRIPDD